MRNISYGDVIRILRNKRIASGIAGAGVGAAGGFLLGDQTNWYNPWKGALAGAAIGGGIGAILPRQAYDAGAIRKEFGEMMQLDHTMAPRHIQYPGYWINPAIGGTLLGLAGTASVTDNPYLIAAGGFGGLIGAKAIDQHMLGTTKFPQML